MCVREVSDEPSLDKGLGRIEKFLQGGVDKGKLTAEREGAGARAASRARPNSRDLADCDLVIEAASRTSTPSARSSSALDAVCAPSAIFASNTSSLSITEMAATTKRPARFVGLHFFNPVPLMKLVEVVRTPLTDDAVLRRRRARSRRGSARPSSPRRTRPGFVVNRLLVPYLLDAIRVLESGVASTEDIDNGMKLGCGHPMGPLTLLDFVGLDTTYYIANIMFDEFREPRFAPPPLLKRMVLAGLARQEVAAAASTTTPRSEVSAPWQRKEVVILGGARTPMAEWIGGKRGDGKPGGALDGRLGDRPRRVAAKGALARAGVAPTSIDHVVMGNALQTRGDAIYGARHVGLKAGMPITVPALTVNRLCGSGIQCVVSAAQMLALGEAKLVLAGGMENMSQAPHVIRGRASGLKLGQGALEDSLMVALTDTLLRLLMAQTSDNLARSYGISREAQDEYALRSHTRAARGARSPGASPRRSCRSRSRRTQGRPSSSTRTTTCRPRHARARRSAKLPPAFGPESASSPRATRAGIVDGAAALVVTTADGARKRADSTPLGTHRRVGRDVGVEPRRDGHRPRARDPRGARARRARARRRRPVRDQRGVRRAVPRRREGARPRPREGQRERRRDRARASARRDRHAAPLHAPPRAATREEALRRRRPRASAAARASRWWWNRSP